MWKEKDRKKVVGVLSSNWIDGNVVRWPRKDAQSLAKAHVQPAVGWLFSFGESEISVWYV